MGYMHIDNLYKNTNVLLFRECYALEKIHGTSAHVAWADKKVRLFAGGENPVNFAKLFDTAKLAEVFTERLGDNTVIFYGEAYGGKQQGMRATYGDTLRFIVFDVCIGDTFVDVPVAAELAQACGFEFVTWEKINADVSELDRLRDLPSSQAIRNGCNASTDRFGFCPPIREGIVIRPLHECRFNDGKRVIAKHKRAEFSERKTAMPVDPDKLKLLTDAAAIAEEWVTEMRLDHVLDKLNHPQDMSATGRVIAAMVEDVVREASGEIVDTAEVRRAIGAAAAKRYKQRVQKVVV